MQATAHSSAVLYPTSPISAPTFAKLQRQAERKGCDVFIASHRSGFTAIFRRIDSAWVCTFAGFDGQPETFAVNA